MDTIMTKQTYISVFKRNNDDSYITKLAKSYLDQIMGLPKFGSVLQKFDLRYSGEAKSFFDEFSQYFSWSYSIDGKENLKGNEAKGPLVIFCNHPHGLADIGIVSEFATKVLKRNDLLFVSNSIVKTVFPLLGEHSICVDNMSKKSSKRYNKNKESFALMKEHLDNGGALCIFPAGEVSHFNLKSQEGMGACTDSIWKKGILKLQAETNAILIPLYIHGRNSNFYLFFRFFSKTFGRLLNFREFLKSEKKYFKAEVRASINEEKSILELRQLLYKTQNEKL